MCSLPSFSFTPTYLSSPFYDRCHSANTNETTAIRVPFLGSFIESVSTEVTVVAAPGSRSDKSFPRYSFFISITHTHIILTHTHTHIHTLTSDEHIDLALKPCSLCSVLLLRSV